MDEAALRQSIESLKMMVPKEQAEFLDFMLMQPYETMLVMLRQYASNLTEQNVAEAIDKQFGGLPDDQRNAMHQQAYQAYKFLKGE